MSEDTERRVNMKNLILETRNCIGYGYMSYLENGTDQEVINFMNNFCMWGSSTKRFDNYNMYELSEDTMIFIQSNAFECFLAKHNINLITNNNQEVYDNALQLVWAN